MPPAIVIRPQTIPRSSGVPLEAAEADAEGLEHYVSETTLRAFAAFVKSRG